MYRKSSVRCMEYVKVSGTKGVRARAHAWTNFCARRRLLDESNRAGIAALTRQTFRNDNAKVENSI